MAHRGCLWRTGTSCPRILRTALLLQQHASCCFCRACGPQASRTRHLRGPKLLLRGPSRTAPHPPDCCWRPPAQRGREVERWMWVGGNFATGDKYKQPKSRMALREATGTPARDPQETSMRYIDRHGCESEDMPPAYWACGSVCIHDAARPACDPMPSQPKYEKPTRRRAHVSTCSPRVSPLRLAAVRPSSGVHPCFAWPTFVLPVHSHSRHRLYVEKPPGDYTRTMVGCIMAGLYKRNIMTREHCESATYNLMPRARPRVPVSTV